MIASLNIYFLEVIMKLLSATLVLFLFLVSAIPVQAGYMGGYGSEQPQPAATPVDDSSVTITSPKNGAITGSDVSISWILKKGSHGDHVHLFVDGTLIGPERESPYELKGLKPGKHTIELKTATKQHVLLGPSDSVTITVQ